MERGEREGGPMTMMARGTIAGLALLGALLVAVAALLLPCNIWAGQDSLGGTGGQAVQLAAEQPEQKKDQKDKPPPIQWRPSQWELPTSQAGPAGDGGLGDNGSSQGAATNIQPTSLPTGSDPGGLATKDNSQNVDFAIGFDLTERSNFDKLTLDGWYNTTSFAADSDQPGKWRQLPEFDAIRRQPVPTAQIWVLFP